jgi:hypothetical protein
MVNSFLRHGKMAYDAFKTRYPYFTGLKMVHSHIINAKKSMTARKEGS